MKNKGIVKTILLLSVLVCALFTFVACGENNGNGSGKEESKYALSFFADGETYHTVKTNGAEAITLPTNPGKTGYSFDGWYFDKDVWANEFNENSLTNNPIKSDTTVYAKFTAIEYNAIFKSGETIVDTVKFTVETKSIAEPIIPERAGYSAKWENYTFAANDIIVNAVYSVINYNIVYNNADGVENTNPSVYNIETATINLAEVSKEGYTFDGWFDKDGNKITEIVKGTTGDIELTARWTEAAEKTTITKSEWEKIFSSKNYTVTVYYLSYYIPDTYGTIKMDGNKMLSEAPIEDTMLYAEELADGKGYLFSVYNKKTGKKSDRIESGSIREYDQYINVFVDKFDLFSYDSDKGEYTWAGMVIDTLTYKNAIAKFENGNLVELTYTLEADGQIVEVVANEIGTTTFTVPDFFK